LETERISEKDIENKLSESERKMTERYLLMMGFSKDEIGKNNLLDLDDEQLQKTIQDKIKGMQSKTQHKTIPIRELDSFLNAGWKLLQIFPTGDKAVMELP
jgi:hypothetical protein